MAGQLELALVTFKQDTLIAAPGKPGAGQFFIIKRGTVGITRQVELIDGEGEKILGPGDFFGVVSAMSAQNRIETVRALTDVTLILIRREQYGEFIHRYPAVAVKIIMDFSLQLRQLDGALSRLSFKKTADTDVSHLFKVADHYNRQGRYSEACYAYQRYLHYCPQGEYALPAREQVEKLGCSAEIVRPEHRFDEYNRMYPKNSMFFAEGEPGDELYILQKGAVKLSRVEDNHEILLGILRGGDIFGEMAMLERKPRTASAVANEDCIVTMVNRSNIEQTIQEQPQIIARLTTLQADRLWFIYKQLANTLIQDPLGRLYGILHIYLERSRIDPGSTQNHLFSCGPRELIGMACLAPAEGHLAMEKLLADSRIKLVKNRFFIPDVSEFHRQTRPPQT